MTNFDIFGEVISDDESFCMDAPPQQQRQGAAGPQLYATLGDSWMSAIVLSNTNKALKAMGNASSTNDPFQPLSSWRCECRRARGDADGALGRIRDLI